MIFSYKTHNQIKIDPGKVIVVSTNNQFVYYDLLTGINLENERLSFLDNNYNLLKTSDAVNWAGDINNYSISKSIENTYKYISKNLNEQQINRIHDATAKLFTEVQECLFMANIPLRVNNDGDITKAFKYCGISIEPSIKNSPYDIMETLVNIQVEINDSRITGLTNVAHYLTHNQFLELSSLCRNTGKSILCIEFASVDDYDQYPECDFYNIDRDFVDWHMD